VNPTQGKQKGDGENDALFFHWGRVGCQGKKKRTTQVCSGGEIVGERPETSPLSTDNVPSTRSSTAKRGLRGSRRIEDLRRVLEEVDLPAGFMSPGVKRRLEYHSKDEHCGDNRGGGENM